MKSSGSACPFDHVSVIVLKMCPTLRSAIHRIIIYCLQNNIILETWKRGFCVLIYKKGSQKQPSNFRPITLEPVRSKLLTSLIRNRIHSYLIQNNYIKTDIQRGFWTGISGKLEDTETLTSMINHVRHYQKNLVTLLDLKNAFGELDHQRINSVLCYRNIPDHIRSLAGSFYTNYSISLGTSDFIRNPVVVEKGALQGAGIWKGEG